MKIVFLCLSYHFKSKSSDWFIDALGNHQVRKIALDADPLICYDILESSTDLVICWQTEEMAPWFNARGVPAIAVPMADAVEHRPKGYFGLTGFVGAVSFTKLTKDGFAANGITPYDMRYYPKPLDGIDAKKKRKIDAFYGYRSLRWKEVNELFAQLKGSSFRISYPDITLNEKKFQVSFPDAERTTFRTHLHDMKDYMFEPVPDGFVFDSRYFGKKSELEKILANSNFFLCPRYAEGIGLFTLDAMQQGCIPIGVRGPGNSDYIEDGVTGFLYDDETREDVPERMIKADVEQLRSNVLRTLKIGYERFNEQISGVAAYVETRKVFFEDSSRLIEKKFRRFKVVDPRVLYRRNRWVYMSSRFKKKIFK